MSTPYKMTFKNATDEEWFFAVYKKFPESPGLSSTAWQVRGVPQKFDGSPPSTAECTWTMNYGLCIADFDMDQNKFTGSQYAPASLGNSYEIISQNGIPSISPNITGTTTTDQITLQNNTAHPVTSVTMGFTVNNNIIAAEQDVGGSQKTYFRVHPEYYVACFHNIVLGQMVDMGVAIEAVPVTFGPGIFSKTITAVKSTAGNYSLEVE